MLEFETSAADCARGAGVAPLFAVQHIGSCSATYGKIAVQHIGRTRDGENTRQREFTPHEATNSRGAFNPATDGALWLRATRVLVVPATLSTSVRASAGGERKPACFTKDSLLRGNVAKQVGRSSAEQ